VWRENDINTAVEAQKREYQVEINRLKGEMYEMQKVTAELNQRQEYEAQQAFAKVERERREMEQQRLAYVAEFERLDKERHQALVTLEAQKQAELEKVYQMTVQEAHVKARQEADRIVNEMQQQYHSSQTLVIVSAQNEEAKAFENFRREAEEQHQIIMQERLGEAQSLGAEKLEHVLQE
jgi:hypothetical protein